MDDVEHFEESVGAFGSTVGIEVMQLEMR